jgi:hypothetical protein
MVRKQPTQGKSMSRKPTGEVRRRVALAKQLQDEHGISKEEALERAMTTMRDNRRGDWRAG